MALTYSLKYKKMNFFQKVLLEKEGEVIIERQSFKLKGKGANDQGENIYFGDIKELLVKEDSLIFTTFGKERFVLSDFSNLFDSFLKDFVRVRNEYLSDTLFMKVGMLFHEYDCSVEILTSSEKIVNKGKSRIQFYEGSIVIIPETRECMVIYLDFLKQHEFDEDDYVLRLFLENGTNITVSKLGTSFEDAQETLETLLGKMYEKSMNNLKEFLPDFDPMTLLKVANKLKSCRAVQFSTLKKMHDDLPAKLENLAFGSNAVMGDKVKILRKIVGDENFYLGFGFVNKMETREIIVKPWFTVAIPEQNVIALGFCSGPQDLAIYFFRIIMEQGDPKIKVASKIMEINQFMSLFKLDMTAMLKDRRELKKTKYRTAVKKLTFLRLLKKSYMGKNSAPTADQFKNDLEKIFAKGKELPVARTGGVPAANRPVGMPAAPQNSAIAAA